MKSSTLNLHKDNYFPSQWEFLINKSKAKIKAYVGGFGSGKTYSFLHCTFINLLTKKNQDGKSNGLILYPTYSLADAVQKSLGRLRGCEDAELYITTTPEGFGYTHHLMCERDAPDKLLVHGKTTDNPYLPKSYIESLKNNYDEQLLKAYIEGQFVNLNQGATYYGFNRDEAVKKCEYIKSLPIRIGMDWNVDPLCCVIFQILSNNKVNIINEIALSHQGGGDLLTQRMCDTIKQIYPNRQYIAYPDATGAARHSSSQFSDLDIVRANGFRLMVKHINPRVVNRVNAMNNQFAKGNITIDPKCRLLIKDLEQVCNKEGTRDIDKSNKNLSHMSDALGYGIEWEFPTKKPNRIGVQDR